MTPEELVTRFAESIGRPAEARLYLELFRKRGSFAVIAPGDLEAPAADALVADLGYLAALGLFPLVWGAGDDLAARARAASLPLVEVATPDEVAIATQRKAIAWAPPRPDLARWALAVAAPRVVLLGGAVRRARGGVVSLIDAGDELEALLSPGSLAPGHRERLERAAAVFDAAGGATVALTSAFDLLRELFTVRGAGTMIRRGAAISRLDDLGAGDAAALLAPLLESAFGRPVKPALFARPLARVYLAHQGEGRERDPAGAAVIEPGAPAPYLSKFAVGPAARGAGIGRDLWRALAADFPRLVWRARAENPITGWYLQKADGFVRAGGWNVFWIGLAPAELEAAIGGALARPEDFGRRPGARPPGEPPASRS